MKLTTSASRQQTQMHESLLHRKQGLSAVRPASDADWLIPAYKPGAILLRQRFDEKDSVVQCLRVLHQRHKYLAAGAHLQAQIVTRRYVAQRHLRGQQLPRQLVHLLQHLRAVHQVMQQVAGNLRTQLHVSKRISLELCSVCTEVLSALLTLKSWLICLGWEVCIDCGRGGEGFDLTPRFVEVVEHLDMQPGPTASYQTMSASFDDATVSSSDIVHGQHMERRSAGSTCLRGTFWLRSHMSTCEEGHANSLANTLATCYLREAPASCAPLGVFDGGRGLSWLAHLHAA